MSHVPFEPVEATVQGSARGRDIAGRWHVSVTSASLALMSPHSPERASFTFAVAELEGAGLGEETLTLYLARGECLTFRESHRLGELSLRLDALCHEVGEVMRASRAAGSRRAGAGSEHDRFFAPFLAARLQLAEAADARARLDAANARELRSAVTGVVTHFAASRFPDDAADRRALLAELEEIGRAH